MLELQNISFGVTEDNGGGSVNKEILNDISLTVGDNRFVVITGPNGGGKSTLAKIIAGIEKPTSGRILLDGKDITDLNVTERAKAGISFAFQQPVRFKGIQVLDLIRLAAGKKMTVADACQYLAEVGLCAKDYINREVNASLSVFDEPEAGIDLWSFQNLIQVFEKMRAQIHDSSIMIISHQERILEIADEIVVLRDGRIDASGPREEILPALIGTPSAVEACKILKSK